MNTVKQELTLRLEEIDRLLSLLSDIESGLVRSEIRNIDVTINANLKASALLMMYNATEATLTSLLRRLHNIINSDGVYYTNASKDIRRLVIAYHHSSAMKHNNIYAASESLETLLSRILTCNPLNISYDDFCKHFQLYSGNIDARLIRKIFLKYGIAVEV